MSESQQMDRRHGNVVREILTPVVVSLIVGVSSSYMSTQLTVNTISTKMEAMKEDVSELRLITAAVQQNQIQIASQSQWMRSTDEKISVINGDLSLLKQYMAGERIYDVEPDNPKKRPRP